MMDSMFPELFPQPAAAAETDAAACPLCSRHGTQYLCHTLGYEVRRCVHCCCDFVWPLPSAEELKAYYDAPEYFHGQAAGSYANYDLDTEAVLPIFRALLDELGADASRSILDIGCAYGTHLAIAAEQGWQAVGVEISDHARNQAIARHGDRIAFFARIEDVPPREFDLVTLFDVIEHMPDPYEVFRTLFDRGLIGRHTVVAMTTPNARSSQAVAEPASWPYRHPPAHLVYYSAHALERFWRKMGVHDVEVRGLYPQEAQAKSFPDEQASSNADLSAYAGLLCLARGFATAPALIDKSAGLGSRADPRRHALEQRLLREQIEERSRAVHRAEARLRSAHEALASETHKLQLITSELQLITSELQELQQSRFFRLRAALRARPVTPGTIARVAALLASPLLPAPVRSGAYALVQKMRRRRDGAPRGPAVEAYRVRIPKAAAADRPRVLHVIANFMTGGSSRLVVDLIENLGADYEQSVLTSCIPSPPAYVGLPISELRDASSEKPFLKHFQRLRPDMIHVHYWGEVDLAWYAKAFRAAEQLGIPVVQNVNTPVTPYWSPAVRRYVYVSDYVRQVFGKTGREHVTIHPGSDFSHFSRRPGEVATGDRVGMVYRLERDKLHDQAIAPFIAAVRRRPQTRVLIVGGGTLLPVFRDAVEAAGLAENFEFTGYVSYAELPDMYRRMALFVAPVSKESFGQVSPFAMNMGVPVCGFDVGAIAEILGDRSLVAPPGDAEALADIIVRLLDSPEEQSAQSRRQQERARDLFSVEAMVAAYGNLYRELLPVTA